MLALTVFIIGVLLFDGALMAYLTWAFHSDRFAAFRFQEPFRERSTRHEKNLASAKSSALSLAMLSLALWLGAGSLFVTGPVHWWVVPLHAVAILAIYDFFYYLMHRFVFHDRRLMKWVHGMHHERRFPNAEDSLWVHPLETAAGLGLLLAVTAATGPVHVVTFGLVFAVYSPLNILNHMGMAFPKGHPLSLFNGVARAHYGHHRIDINRNFATLTMAYDKMFGTYEHVEAR